MHADRARPLPYTDHTGNMATANVDRERNVAREASAAHVLQALSDPRTSHRDAIYLMRAIGPELADAA